VVGVLAVQGAFDAHRRVLASLGADAREVRNADQLAAVDALVIPGGESTTMAMLLDRTGLRAPLADRLDAGMPVFGTCAGMILLADDILDGRPDQWSFRRLDVAVRRNAYGRQRESFETDLTVVGLDAPFHAVFIRAPGVVRAGDGVEVLAELDGDPVLVRQGPVMAAAFHPELTADGRVHQLFLDVSGG
jgi:5'-phosphate synthase pdxT subunit